MGYYVRAFCTQGEFPPLRPILAFSAERGAPLDLDPEVGGSGLDDSLWDQAGIVYKNHKASILLELSRDEGKDESLVRAEIEEFMDILEDAPKNRYRRRVETNLRNTRFIVAAKLPPSGIDEDDFAALGNIMRYLINNNGAMIQADGEGFYEGEKIIVALD